MPSIKKTLKSSDSRLRSNNKIDVLFVVGGTAGPVMPLLAVADAYASMIAEWPGHLAMKTDEAKVALKVAAGRQFDPNIVEALLRALEAEK